jgi:hypothetical protein
VRDTLDGLLRHNMALRSVKVSETTDQSHIAAASTERNGENDLLQTFFGYSHRHASAFLGGVGLAQTTSQPQTTPAPSGIWERSNLLGDMGGLRTALGNYGVSLNITDARYAARQPL